MSLHFNSNVIFPDGVSAKFGTDLDGEVKHTGSNLQIQENTGNIQITNYGNDKDVVINTDDGSGGTANYFKADGSTGETILYNYGNEKIKTTGYGVTVFGTTETQKLNVTGISTFTGNIDANGSLDVDGTVKVGTGITMDATSGIITATGDGTFDDIRVGQWLGHANYAGVFHKNQTGNEYMILSQDDHTFVSASTGHDVVIRGGNNTNTNNIRVTPDSGGIQISGNTTFNNDINVTGNVSIGGTLTYEDVTNIDSIGIVTARNGIHVTGG